MATNENFLVPYQSAVKSQGFQTQQAPDLTAQLRRNQAVAQQNFADIQNAFNQQAALNKLDALAPFSENLSKFLITGEERRIKKVLKENAAEFYEDKAAYEQALAAHKQQLVPLKELDKEFSAAALDAIRQGLPFSAADGIKKRSDWARYAYAETAAIAAGEGYESWMLNQRQTNKGTITLFPGTPQAKTISLNDQSLDTAESAAARAHLREQYIAGTGLANLSKGLQATAFKAMEAADLRMTALAEKNYAIRKSQEEREITMRNLITPGHSNYMDLSAALTNIASTFDKNNKALGGAGAQNEVRSFLLNAAAQGFEIPFREIENQIVAWDPKKRTFKELYGKPGQWLSNLEFEVAQVQQEQQRKADQKFKQDWENWERNVAVSLLNAEGGFSTELAMQLNDTYKKNTGRDSSLIMNLIDSDSKDAEYIKEREEEAQAKLTTGLLDQDYVDTLPLSIRPEFQKVLDEREKALAAEPGHAEGLAAVKKIVPEEITDTVGNAFFVRADLIKEYFKHRRDGKSGIEASTLVTSNYNDIQKTKPNHPYFYRNGYYSNYGKDTVNNLLVQNQKRQQLIKQVNTTHSNNLRAAADDPDLEFFTLAQHKQMALDFGVSPDFEFPREAEMFKPPGMSMIEFVNHRRKVRGLGDPLVAPEPRFPVNEDLKETLLKRNPTPQRVVRAIVPTTNLPVRSKLQQFVPNNTQAASVNDMSYDDMRPLLAATPLRESPTSQTKGIDTVWKDGNSRAYFPGVVKNIGTDFRQGGTKGFGHYIVIEHTDPLTGEKFDGIYSHLDAASTLKPGQQISAGQIVGIQGSTGRTVPTGTKVSSFDALKHNDDPNSKDMTPYENADFLLDQLMQNLTAN